MENLYNSTVNVERKGDLIEDGIGGFLSDEWSTHIESVLCRIQPLKSNEKIAYGKETVLATHKMFCSAEHDITEQDRIVRNGIYYDIIEVINIDMMDHHLEITLDRVK